MGSSHRKEAIIMIKTHIVETTEKFDKDGTLTERVTREETTEDDETRYPTTIPPVITTPYVYHPISTTPFTVPKEVTCKTTSDNE